MNRFSLHIILLFGLFQLPFVAIAQKNKKQEYENKKNQIIEQRIEIIAEQTGGEDLDFTTLFDELSNYYDNPVNLNHTTREELRELMLLNDFQINNLFKHIEENGKLISIYELQSIAGWNIQTIQNVLPFVYVADNFSTPHISIKKLFEEGKQEWFWRWQRILQTQKGFLPVNDSILQQNPNAKYYGSPDRIYTRYRFRFGTNVSWGFTAEKDAGEQFFKGFQKQGFDFYSGHIFLRNIGKLKALAIGDYQVSFGQGLTFATGLAFGKSANTLGIKRSQLNLRPYTSVDENQFMRGGAVTYSLLKHLELTAFYSSMKVDGNRVLNPSADTLQNISDDGIIISSLQTSGFHRNPGEVEDRNIIRYTHYGGHIAYKTRKLNLGLTGVYSKLGGQYNRNLSYYNQFEFNRNSNFVMGTDYNWLYKNYNFFGEISRSENGGMAHSHGVIASLSSNLAVIVQYRNYDKDYQTLFANAITEGSRPVNEKGLYTGFEAKLSSQFFLNAYIDIFQSDWLRYQVNSPSYGKEYLAQLNWRPSRKIEAYLRIRYIEKAANTNESTSAIKFTENRTQQNIRFNITYKLNDWLTLRNRFEILEFKQPSANKETGYLLYQDIMYKALSSPVSFTLRYALFDTDSYNSRIYAYENDVLYVFSVPAYYYRGSRAYFLLRYQYKKWFDIWLRYGVWLYNNRTSIGSGLDEIQGNKRSDIKIQIRFSF